MFKGDANWRKIAVKGGLTFKWDDRSTYVQNPPYFEGMQKRSQPIEDIVDARILGLFLEFDHHRPHLAGRARSRKTAPPANICAIIRCGRRTSTSTARGAAIIR